MSKMWWDDKERMEALCVRYDAVRKALGSRALPGMQKCLNRQETLHVAKELGVYHRGTVVFDSQEQSIIVMDYAMMFSRMHGTTPCERYLKLTAQAAKDELLQAAHNALASVRYAFLLLLERRPNVGFVCHDMLAGGVVFLFDRSLSNTDMVGLLIATPIMDFEGGVISTGAALHMGSKPLPETTEVILDYLRDLELPSEIPMTLSGRQQTKLARATIKGMFATAAFEE